jgi:putative hydrolase of the HAD superfamily
LVTVARHRAVIFDLGGVVFESPLHAIAEFERELGIEPGAVNRLVVARGEDGAWARLERGELRLEEFHSRFEAECAAAGHPLCARTMMERIAAATRPRPRMLAVIRALRARSLLTAALTNNWEGDGGAEPREELRALFDVLVESRAVGLRKPDPRIYRLVLERLGVTPAEAIFLDDIGRNLKPARALGIETIRVENPERALAELERALGFPLLDPA